MTEKIGDKVYELDTFTEKELTEAELIFASDKWVTARNAASRDDHRNGGLNQAEANAMARVNYLLEEYQEHLQAEV